MAGDERQTLDINALVIALEQGMLSAVEVDPSELRYVLYARKSTTGEDR